MSSSVISHEAKSLKGYDTGTHSGDMAGCIQNNLCFVFILWLGNFYVLFNHQVLHCVSINDMPCHAVPDLGVHFTCQKELLQWDMESYNRIWIAISYVQYPVSQQATLHPHKKTTHH